MRIMLIKYKFIILAVLLMAGVSIVGLALAFHYDNKAKSAGSQKELKNDNQAANVMPLTLDRSKIILLLVITGLIGFLGVRRKNNTLKKFEKAKHPDIKLRVNLLPQNNQKRQACQLGKPDCAAS